MPGKILILESVPTNRIVLKVKLSSAFYQVAQACNLSEALQKIRTERPDLVLVGSDDPDGQKTAKIIKALRVSTPANLPIVILSGTVSRAHRLAALSAGADDVLVKPVDEAVLLARTRSILRTRDTEDELRLRDNTTRALGFAESPERFAGRGTVQFATSDSGKGLRWRTQLKPLVPYAMGHRLLKDSLRAMTKMPVPDAFVIAMDAEEPETSLRLLAEIRARTATRHSGVLVALPESFQDCAIDALDLGANEIMQHGFDPEEMAIRLSRIIQRKRYRDGLRQNVQQGLEAAATDPLTGLYNRRYALPHLKRIAEYSSRSRMDYAVMIADLDHFKAVNDRYGHSAGDQVLKTVADRLKSVLRPADLLARIGGEEFLIVLPATHRKKATQMANDMRRAIEETPVCLQKRDLSIPVTISIGLAMANDYSCGGEPGGTALIDRADQALYSAKATGRNQVMLEAHLPKDVAQAVSRH